VEKWFGEVKHAPGPEPITIPGAVLSGVQKKTITDRVQLPRLYLAWITPRHFEPGDAALDLVADVLAGGKNSRLYKRLVYDMQIAQEVSASQASAQLSSQFEIVATPRPGHTVDELKTVIDEEVQRLQREEPSAHELERSINQIEASFYNRMERVGGFGGKGDQLNAYFTSTGIPDWFNEDLARSGRPVRGRESDRGDARGRRGVPLGARNCGRSRLSRRRSQRRQRHRRDRAAAARSRRATRRRAPDHGRRRAAADVSERRA